MDRRPRCAAWLTSLACASAAVAAPPAAEMQLASCVRGSPPLRVATTSERAVLDTADLRRFQDAAQARYPLYQRGGLQPAQVLLLRRGGQWQYMTLAAGGPQGVCVTAVFAADRFDFTPGWLAKYQPKAADADD